MSDFIRRAGNGTDLILETTLIDALGVGIAAGVTVTASIQRMSDTNYWTLTPDFDSGVEGSLHSLAHIREGLWAFTLTGGAEGVERPYRIHIVITGNPQVNRNATISDVIEVAAAPGDATLANQVTIIANQGTPSDLGSGANLSDNNVDIDAKTTNLPADPASETNVTNNGGGINQILSVGGSGPWSSGDIGNVELDDTPANIAVLAKIWDQFRSAHIVVGSFGQFTPADLVRWEGSATIDGLTITKFGEILMAYTTGRFKINFPLDGDITFYEQDNTTVIFTMHITATERTRL